MAGANGTSMGYAELPGPATIETFQNHVFSLVQGNANPAIAQWPNPNVTHVGDLYISFSDSISLYQFMDAVWILVLATTECCHFT